MDIILTKELTEAINKVGELIRSDARYAEMASASEDYNNNKELSNLLDEYAAVQEQLAKVYERVDFEPSDVKPLQERMGEIYEVVSSHPAYVRFREASELYSEMTNAVYAELEYAVTGVRKDECTHDCSTCHGCG